MCQAVGTNDRWSLPRPLRWRGRGGYEYKNKDSGFPIKNGVGNDPGGERRWIPRSEPVLDVCNRGSGMTDNDKKKENSAISLPSA